MGLHQVPIGPEFDLHAFAPADIPAALDAYLHEAHAAGLRDVRIVHGRGRGVQRGIVQSLLDRHPLVAEFSEDTAAHLGASLVGVGNRRSGVAPRGQRG
jgi:DNA-nicking Smr family endonuclease